MAKGALRRPFSSSCSTSRFGLETLLAGGVQRGGNAGELRVQRVAESAGADDDGERDEGSDQAIFDSRRAGLILDKARKKLGHSRAPTPRVTALPSTLWASI